VSGASALEPQQLRRGGGRWNHGLGQTVYGTPVLTADRKFRSLDQLGNERYPTGTGQLAHTANFTARHVARKDTGTYMCNVAQGVRGLARVLAVRKLAQNNYTTGNTTARTNTKHNGWIGVGYVASETRHGTELGIDGPARKHSTRIATPRQGLASHLWGEGRLESLYPRTQGSRGHDVRGKRSLSVGGAEQALKHGTVLLTRWSPTVGIRNVDTLAMNRPRAPGILFICTVNSVLCIHGISQV
jgi:hypothetical protein